MDRVELLARFRTGYADVEAAVAGLTDADLDHPAPDGGWSEATAYVRLRRLIAEDEPSIQGYDEPEFARRLHYDRPIESSLRVLAAVRAASLELLEVLGPEEWERRGTHTESGSYSVEDWLRIYSAHSHDHADQIRAALA